MRETRSRTPVSVEIEFSKAFQNQLIKYDHLQIFYINQPENRLNNIEKLTISSDCNNAPVRNIYQFVVFGSWW